jgi:tetratricopeptide (TPR) repeat protein
MKRITLLVFITFSAFILTAAAQNSKKYFKTGQEFIESGNYQDAVAQFSKAIELDPQNTDMYLARARAYVKLNQLQEALDDCNRAKVFSPKNDDIFSLAGEISLEMKKYEDALANLNTATGLNKRSHDPYQYKTQALIELEKYETAMGAIDTALLIEKNNSMDNYLKGVVNERLRNYSEAEKYYRKAFGNEGFVKPYLALAQLKVKQNQLNEAFSLLESALKSDPKSTEAFYIRSQIYTKQLDFPNAINDISKNIILEPGNPDWYIVRGGYYQQFNQQQYAINDFNKLISLTPDNPDAYFMRAKSYEEILDYPSAIKDYQKIASLSEFNVQARKLLKDAQDRLFELNRENDSPEITLAEPVADNKLNVQVPGNKDEVILKGSISEVSPLAYFKINGNDVHVEKEKNGYTFLANVNVKDTSAIHFEVADVYDNKQNIEYTITRTETKAPVVSLIAPYASDNGEVYLSSNDPRIYVEGKIQDESKIHSITVEGLNASYRADELNPTFSATIDISNKGKFSVIAEDIYGNQIVKDFTLNREGAVIAQNNPMGKTWVVFIENSKYESFASLDGPTKDVSMMKMALVKYDVQNIIHKQDLTKAEMEKFFTIELRDLVRSNQVNSLLIWYAGHGKFINDVGYWVPVDAQRDDEFTYYNINSLRAAMQPYQQYLTHLLVVTDACESGPTFYQAMRSAPKEKTCDDWTATKFKSSQVFSSAGYELAVDNSQFTRTFANTLANNPNACLPIENVVSQVTVAVAQNNQQRPKFGKIAGLEDEDGTFFFILK